MTLAAPHGAAEQQSPYGGLAAPRRVVELGLVHRACRQLACAYGGRARALRLCLWPGAAGALASLLTRGHELLITNGRLRGLQGCLHCRMPCGECAVLPSGVA